MLYEQFRCLFSSLRAVSLHPSSVPAALLRRVEGHSCTWMHAEFRLRVLVRENSPYTVTSSATCSFHRNCERIFSFAHIRTDVQTIEICVFRVAAVGTRTCLLYFQGSVKSKSARRTSDRKRQLAVTYVPSINTTRVD